MTRMLPTRYAAGIKPIIIKRMRAKLAHISPPSKGLSLQAQTNTIDAQFAGILTNFYVDDDRITCRSGYRKLTTMPGAASIDHLIPSYGTPERLAAATNLTLCDAQTAAVLKSGFTSNDWHWTAFANLSQVDFTVMVNGFDGIWSWDGGATPDGTSTSATAVTNANPAVVTVAAGNISRFSNGMTVTVAGATTTGGWNVINGNWIISSVGTPANTFTLLGCNASTCTGTVNAGVTALPLGSFIKEVVTPPAGNTWLDPNKFHVVLAHMNRLWFADTSNLAVSYLPIQQKSGTLAILPLNSIFKRGGTIKAMGTWTVDGGMGMDDQLVVFTTNGEVAIYSGVDPASDMSLVGVYRFDPPMSKHSVANYGGELYVMIPTGVTPMTAMIRAGKEGLETVDRSVVPIFLQNSISHLSQQGWELFLNPSSGRMFANIPQGGGRYIQMIRHMPKAVWTQWQDVPARCLGWMSNYVYFGDDKGNVYQMHPQFQTDDGVPIRVDVQMAWSQFKTPALKHFKMILPYIITDGHPRPRVDVRVDYDNRAAENEPELSSTGEGDATWNTATWDVDAWVGGAIPWANWTGVGSLGRVGAIRLTASIANCSFSVTGFDLLYEEGSVFG